MILGAPVRITDLVSEFWILRSEQDSDTSEKLEARTEHSELSELSEHSELCFHNFYIGYVQYKWFDYVCHKENSYLVLHKPAPYPHHHQSCGDFDVFGGGLGFILPFGPETSGSKERDSP
jgi:hypothetical protein